MGLAERVFNRSLDYLLFNPALERYWLARMRGRVLCLLYHRVDEPGRRTFLDQGGVPVIDPAELERDLRFLIAHGARFLTFADLRRGEFPAPDEIGVILSFDDGFIDNYTTALEVLDSLGIRCTIFQSTALVESDELIWEHRLYWHAFSHADSLLEAAASWLNQSPASMKEAIHLLRETVSAPMVEQWLGELEDDAMIERQHQQARALYPARRHLQSAIQAGHEIGSHGHRHYKREHIDAGLFEREIRQSRERLREITGAEPACFSYPFNSRRPGDEAICARYFEQLATVDGGFIEPDTDPLHLPRVTWPGTAKNDLRRRRWLVTGRI